MTHKSKPRVFDSPQVKFEFDKSFKRRFDALIGLYSNALNDLNTIIKGKNITSDYGVCNCSYKLRYVTPKDVSAYISNLIKGIRSGLFHNRVSDIEMFTVASVKRFLEDNECDPFETSSAVDNSNRYVNPSEYTLNDLAFLCENDIGNVAVYSKGEMLKRLQLMSEDVKKLNDLHFAANMKKIVSSLPDVLEKGDNYLVENRSSSIVFRKFLEEFLLLICTMNTITILQMTGYGKPAVDYSTKTKNDNPQDVVTECCLCKTNDYMIRNNLPFNCNMRDVVLQDVTPDFRDIHDALHFIMKDPRSPISILVNKYASKEADVNADSWMVGQMFLGCKHDMCDDDVFDKATGERLIGTKHPHDVAGFKTSVTWLDNIAFGNNYLDGNYRRDGVGHHKRHPITNTLDTLYKVYGGCDLKSNEDLANNIVRVACLMRSIINEQRNGEPIENYDITKDILAVLGEIFTRNMLRLYYNNTRVFVYSDDIPGTGDPGLLYCEGFIMEDSQPTPTNNAAATNNNAQNGGTKTAAPGVTFTNQSGQNVKANMKTKTSILVNSFIQWVRNTMSKFFENFNKNHAKEIEYIKNNAALHEEIGKAIQSGQFNPNVTNFPDFKIPADKLSGMKVAETVKKYSDIQKMPKFDNDAFIFDCFVKDDTLIKSLKQTPDVAKRGEIWSNYVLYSSPTQPQLYTGKMSPDQWKNLCKDLTDTLVLVKQVTEKMSSDLASASDDVKSQIQKYETAQGQDSSITAKKERMDAINSCIQTITKTYETAALNTLISKFYNSNYKIYSAIITNYKQQKANPQPATQPNQQQQQNGAANNNGQNQQGNGDSLNANAIPGQQ